MKLIIVSLLFFILVPHAHAVDIKPNGKAVLVTGASSGIGRSIAEHLASKGVFVYAGARKQKDLTALSAIKNIQGIRLDVTKPEQISAAVRLVEKEGRGLHGLVNNAGVFFHAPMIEVSEEDMQFMMDVNLFGPYRVTKAFAPLLIESKGRISTTGSIAGVSSGPMFGPYSMSKFAIEAFNDALASEMKKFDVQVSVIEPGNFKSNIMKNMHKRVAKMEKNNTPSLYEAEYQAMLGFTAKDRSQHKDPIAVAHAVYHALFAEQAKPRYMVVPSQQEADLAIRSIFRHAVQMNAGHDFSRSPEELTQTLNALLK
jgi:NAD(P)-dependent dehydrogenase (short-subunit alcohol dehydrogenase family)